MLSSLRTARPSFRLFSGAQRGMATEIKKVGVMGLGQMGHGIVEVSARAGLKVVAWEMNNDLLQKGIGMVEKSVSSACARDVKKMKMHKETADKLIADVKASIKPTTDKKDFADCDLVIEGIVENIDIKKSVFAELGRICKKETILSSNTSSLSITEMGEASGRPEKMLGLHFFNPVQVMMLLEVVRTAKSDQDSFDAAYKFAKKIRKVPVAAKDTPGFIVNRLLVPYLGQAMFLYERGDASIPDIDTAARLGMNHPMGPFTLADYVGLDTSLYILQGWHKKFPNEPDFQIPKTLEAKVKEGKLGRKVGAGFFKWEGDKPVGLA